MRHFRTTVFSTAILAGFILPHLATSSPTAGKGVSADAALTQLKQGNGRFVQGKSKRPHQDRRRLAETAKGQAPFAVILTCSDSRVAPEILFDQGIGDLFVVRVAGNVANVSEIGTVDYGTEHLGAKLLIVMGHTNCGAVKAVAEGADVNQNIQDLVEPIGPAVERASSKNNGQSGSAVVPAAIRENVWVSIENLYKRSENIRTLTQGGKLKTVGAVYDLATGKVTWMGEHPDTKTWLH